MNTLCRGGCGTSIFMAIYEKSGKKAPLCRPTGGMKPNIAIYTREDGETCYRFVKDETAEFVNHFGNCPMAARFRPSPKGDTL